MGIDMYFLVKLVKRVFWEENRYDYISKGL